MIWLFAIAILALLVYSKGFRKFALGFIGLSILITLVVIGKMNADKEKSYKKIAPSELSLEDIELNNSYSSSFNFTTRVKNNSKKYTVKWVEIKVTMKDISEKDPKGVIVGEDTGTIYKDIPPRQARDASASIYMHNMNPKGRLEWSYEIVKIKAE